MKTIYKFIIDEPVKVIEMLWYARVISFGSQYGRPCVWAFVDPEEKRMKKVTIRLVGTGHPIDDNIPIGEIRNRFIGTALFNDDTLVLHAFSDDNKDGI